MTEEYIGKKKCSFPLFPFSFPDGAACQFVENDADFFELRCSGLVTALSAAENAPPEAAMRLLSSSLGLMNGRTPRPVAKSGAAGMFGGDIWGS